MPKPVDAYVGNRVRLRRKFRNVSQGKLAEALDLTFQQVQKYERGTNRVSASTLYDVAKFLEVPVGYFFEGFEDASDAFSEQESAPEMKKAEFWSSGDGERLATKFPKIRDARLRNRILSLIDVLAIED